MAERYATYHVRVHGHNRHAGYGTPLTVIAATRQDAVNRAIDIGWGGRSSDAVVTIDRIEDLDPRETPATGPKDQD